MNLTRATLEKRAISYFVTFLLVFGGISAYMSLGQLEDPEFTVKTAAHHQGRYPEPVLVKSYRTGMGQAAQQDPRYRGPAAPGGSKARNRRRFRLCVWLSDWH